MAIALEHLNLVIPIKTIDRHYPGGWKQCLNENADFIGSRIWFDDHLFRDGAINTRDVSDLIDKWVDIGLRTIEETNGEPRWLDCCVVSSCFGYPTLPCSWIKMSTDGWSASLKSKVPGKIIGREFLAA
jgi:hypothetical protein